MLVVGLESGKPKIRLGWQNTSNRPNFYHFLKHNFYKFRDSTVATVETVVFWVATLYSCQWLSLQHSVFLSVIIIVTLCTFISEYHCDSLYSCQWIPSFRRYTRPLSSELIYTSMDSMFLSNVGMKYKTSRCHNLEEHNRITTLSSYSNRKRLVTFNYGKETK